MTEQSCKQRNVKSARSKMPVHCIIFFRNGNFNGQTASWYFDLPKGPVHARYSKSILYGIFLRQNQSIMETYQMSSILYIYIYIHFLFCEIIKFVFAI